MNESESSTSSAAPYNSIQTARQARRRRLIWIGLLIIIVLIAVALWHRHRVAGGAPAAGGRFGAGGAGAATGPQSVRVATVVQGNMPVQLNALGTVTPIATVTVRTQISGQLMEVGFTEGQMVRKGDFLAQIDPRPYEISLQQAQGTLAHDSALLAQAQADLQRYETLLKQDSIGAQQVDDQRYLVKQYNGQVDADRAQVRTYQLDLTYCHIVAPVDGRVGLRQVDPGNYAQTSDTNGIVIITTMTPMSVIFTIPEDNLPPVLARLNSGAHLPVQAYDRSNSTLLSSGVLQTVDNQIDTTTGTLKLRAAFPNTDLKLFPSQFVNARLLVDVRHDAVVVPSSAIQTGSIGQYVYIAKPDNTVSVSVVKTDIVDGERTSVLSGVAPGDKVVIDGTDRLREGSKIEVVTAPAIASGSELGVGKDAVHTGKHGWGGASHAWGASGASGASAAHAHHHQNDAQ
jgi:membrane fusion protein, multidrug efflux system